VHRFDDLLTWRQALAESFTAQPFTHRIKERSHHSKFDVRVEQCRAHVTERGVKVSVAKAPARSQGTRDSFQSFAEGIKHVAERLVLRVEQGINEIARIEDQ